MSFPGSNLPLSMRPKMRFSTKFYTCEGHEDRIERSLAGVRHAFVMTRYRLRNLRNFLETNPTGDSEMKGIDRSTLYTFESIYGPVYIPKNAGGYIGAHRINHVMGMLDKLIDRIPSHGLDIWCSDDFLDEMPPPGTERPEVNVPKDQGLFYDLRTVEEGGQRWIITYPCENASLVAVLHRTRLTLVDRDTIRICPRVMEALPPSDPILDDTRIAARAFEDGVPLDSFHSSSLANTLIHELSHSYIILGSLATDDVDGMHAYYWEGITYHATEPARALRNADNFAYFAVVLPSKAMLLGKNHWGTGLSEPMLKDGPARDSPP
ncbi:hypothetical protein FQN49_005267 [Arthroderma sp. PD_2]|nr:hypothetical protein FQN49_005267 [Arthroderma sp. PD_2]